jgi:hypothetical protein
MLKQQTAAARQFRAAEFEYGCLQAVRAGIIPPPAPEHNGLANMANQGSLALIVPGSSTSSLTGLGLIPVSVVGNGNPSPGEQAVNEFESYLQQSNSS